MKINQQWYLGVRFTKVSEDQITAKWDDWNGEYHWVEEKLLEKFVRNFEGGHWSCKISHAGNGHYSAVLIKKIS